MADKYLLCIIGEMDRLWFQQIILFSQQPIITVSSSVAPAEPVENHVPISESSSCSSSILSLPLDEETSTDESSPSPEKQASSESILVPTQDGLFNNKEEMKERFARMDLLDNRTRSCSSSPSIHKKRNRKCRKPATSSSSTKILYKSMSCRTLGELELDEVKGFMDLGFMFKKEYISPRMISVVPGLQRLVEKQVMDDDDDDDVATAGIIAQVEGSDEIEAEEKQRDITRPYLSEAWLIKRPDSPLLNLKIPKHCSSANMKKHLKFWAKSVASEIHQE